MTACCSEGVLRWSLPLGGKAIITSKSVTVLSCCFTVWVCFRLIHHIIHDCKTMLSTFISDSLYQYFRMFRSLWQDDCSIAQHHPFTRATITTQGDGNKINMKRYANSTYLKQSSTLEDFDNEEEEAAASELCSTLTFLGRNRKTQK